MEVWFSIQIAWKISLKTNQSPGKRKVADLPYGTLFFQGRPGILHPSPCMDIKWNSPMQVYDSVIVTHERYLKAGIDLLHVFTYLL